MKTPTKRRAPGAWFTVVLLLSVAAHAQAPQAAPPVQWSKIVADMPSGDVTFPAGDGAQIATSQCLICHSAGTILRQPPQAQAQWLAEIRKMRAIWGAPIPVGEEQALSRYLARINGPAAAK